MPIKDRMALNSLCIRLKSACCQIPWSGNSCNHASSPSSNSALNELDVTGTSR
ncbi:hypothetical protein [Xenorhabdus littoralis]|uniref:hypothetical protein n=1 Tax=Xenorhabdus littoralis TaxID=2582835 RepID=UPI0029E7F7FC|nr:hypothetical protein [Xenorhabdus sp. psl]